jgi:hypothetical protein
MRHHPRQEPGAVIPPAGIRAGGRPKGRSLPRPLTQNFIIEASGQHPIPCMNSSRSLPKAPGA